MHFVSPRSETGRLAHHGERPVQLRTIAIYREMVIERGDSLNSQPLHHGKTGAVHEGEILVRESLTDSPSRLQVGGADRLDGGRVAAKPLPETFRGRPAESVTQQHPSLTEYVIARDKVLTGR